MPPRPVAVIARKAAAAALRHPLRLRILEALREPGSAAGIARSLKLPRQRVNYHVRELARAGLLTRAGQRRRGNTIERRYVAAAASYVLSPELLGSIGSPALHSAAGKNEHGSFSMAYEVRFESTEQQAWFDEELERAVLEVIDRVGSPATDGAGGPAAGRLYRVVVAAYPASD